MKVERVEPRFGEFIPDVLEDGVLYVSMSYGTVIHRCCCGCGEKVSTPLHPAQWRLTYDGEAVSLSPSIGSGSLPCRSHYFITRNDVRWAAPMSKTQTAAGVRRDRAALSEHYEPTSSSLQRRPSWPGRLKDWVLRRGRRV